MKALVLVFLLVSQFAAAAEWRGYHAVQQNPTLDDVAFVESSLPNEGPSYFALVGEYYGPRQVKNTHIVVSGLCNGNLERKGQFILCHAKPGTRSAPAAIAKVVSVEPIESVYLAASEPDRLSKLVFDKTRVALRLYSNKDGHRVFVLMTK